MIMLKKTNAEIVEEIKDRHKIKWLPVYDKYSDDPDIYNIAKNQEMIMAWIDKQEDFNHS